MLLRDKVAFITGGGSGIGEATAKLFAAEGANVIIADIDEVSGERVSNEIGSSANFIKCDVTNEENVFEVINEITKTYNRLDCAVNNAGITGTPANIEDTTYDIWSQVIQVNLTGVFFCLKHEISQMIKQGFGNIVNVSSGAGLIAVPSMAAYCASKHALLGLTKTAATENLARGIRVNSVLPGSTKTPLLDQALNMSEGMEEIILNSIPSGKFGTPKEVAEGIAWLCSDRASFVSGASLAIDYGTVSR